MTQHFCCARGLAILLPGVDEGEGVFNYCSKSKTTFRKLDITVVVSGAILLLLSECKVKHL